MKTTLALVSILTGVNVWAAPSAETRFNRAILPRIEAACLQIPAKSPGEAKKMKDPAKFCSCMTAQHEHHATHWVETNEAAEAYLAATLSVMAAPDLPTARRLKQQHSGYQDSWDSMAEVCAK